METKTDERLAITVSLIWDKLGNQYAFRSSHDGHQTPWTRPRIPRDECEAWASARGYCEYILEELPYAVIQTVGF